MQCPKCKSDIAENVLRCPNCKLKVRIVCPKCKTINKMGQKICTSCGYDFFVKCENCGTINLSSSKFCRKCGDLLIKKAEESKTEKTKETLISTPQEDTVTEALTKEIPEEKQPVLEEYNREFIEKNTETIEDTSVENQDNRAEEEIQTLQADQTSVKKLQEENLFEENINNKENPENSEVTENEEGLENKYEETSEEEEIKNNVKLTDDGFMISTEEVDISDEQIKDLFDKVEKIEKNQERKAEAEAEIQKKFEQREEIAQEEEEIIPPEYVQLDQKDAQTTIIDAIQNPLKKIISLNGKEGLGKSLIIKYVKETLRKENYIWAWGECSALTQITPFGYIQDVLLNLFNLANFCTNIDEFIKNNTKALEAQFFNLNPKEIDDLINFLYPVKTSEFNGILKRKEYTINILKKVFKNMTMKSLIIFVADDFENIDGASFDFLKNILVDSDFQDKIKILITNKHNKIAQGYFYDKELKHNNYSNIFLSGLDEEQCKTLIETLYGPGVKLPENLVRQIAENAKGTSAYVEQACLLLNEIGAITSEDGENIIFNEEFIDYELPCNTYRILEERLNLLEKGNPVLLQTLYYASLLGNKFNVLQLENVLQFLKISKDFFNQICNFLISSNYFAVSVLSENCISFTNTLVWHYIYEKAKTDENFVEYNNNIYACIKPLTLSNNSLKPLLLQNADKKREACEYWENNAELASYLGDTNLYVISLKQQLKIANDIPDVLTAQEKIHIFDKMGKILYKISPKEAVTYLSASIAYYKEETNFNPIRIIELSAFLVQACKKTGDYLGVMESCDVALEALPQEEYAVEKALIASKKLNALLHIGNSEEIINLTNSEILGIVESALANPHSSNIVSDSNIFEIWVDTSLTLASAYAIQGNKKCFEVLSKVDDAITVNKIENEKYMRQILITKALAYSLRGEIKLSSDTLTSITSKYSTDSMEEEYILRWNFINVINKIISKDYQNLVDEMYQITTFADNINDMFTKNMLKLLLGYIIQTKSMNINKAVEIYNDEIVFFTKEKIATGAILTWYLIAGASLVTQGVDFALDIALKALDVAKGPKINNYLYIILLKLLIADIYMIKNDFEAVKMYLEKALTIAQNNDLRFMQMLLYNSIAKYNEEMVSIYKDNALTYAQNAVDMYNSALKICKNLMLTAYENTIKKDLTAIKVAFQLKNLEIIIED